MPNISIIIASYNEQGNIGKAIKTVRKILPDAEIIVVDDGSKDQTVNEARQFQDSLVKIIPCKQNRGKGFAIRKGIEAASGSVMAQLDADLQFPAQGLPSLLQPIIDDKTDIVFSSRYINPNLIEKESVSLIKRMASLVVAIIVSFICRQKLTDVFAGFKAWKSEVIRDLNIQEDGFTYEAEIAIKAIRKKYRLIEIPTEYKKRIAGQSKIRLIYHTCSVAWRIFKIAVSP